MNFSSPLVTVSGSDAYRNVRTLSSGTFTLASYTDASCTTAGVGADLTTSGTGFTSGNWRVNTATYKKAGTFYFKVSTSGAETPCSTGTVFAAKLAPWLFRGY